MALTYSPISTTTLGSDQATVTFSSIPGTYTDLVLIISGYSSSDGAVPWLQFNSDTATNYSQTFMSGNGTTTRSDRNTNLTSLWTSYSPGLSTTSTNISNVIVNIQNYANTTTFKTTLMRLNTASGNFPGTSAGVGLWRKTPEAITTILVGITAGNFKSGSTFTLYGIKSF